MVTSRPKTYIEANEWFGTIATPTSKPRRGAAKNPKVLYEASLISGIDSKKFVERVCGRPRVQRINMSVGGKIKLALTVEAKIR